MSTCTTPDCEEPPVVLIRSDGMNDLGIQLFVLWSGWDRVDGHLYCAEHAGNLLAALPSLRPMGGTSDAGGSTYTHG